MSASASAVAAERRTPPTGGPGRTVIAERVVEKIAALAVQDAERVSGSATRVLGVPLGRDRLQQPAQVNAWVDGQVTGLTVRVSLDWPASARGTARRLRVHIVDRVQQLTGLRVDHVDIDIVGLPPTPRPTRRVVR
ncbi:Asp23/Gls24 family envelope stress response protein [Streptacidiphilus griseoplanus]|uniref:Asp23/Gls24 family envelope stress response protein n=1 Tax=Peterkaempfera griseoplana TaxID=66896 RepID=UPI0006E18F8F|nr:Asp23/Gls24 family envelope stress response protein [Peterkaempfera griseoplana]